MARGLAAFAGFKSESATGVSGSGARVAAIGTKAAPSSVMTRARCFKVRVESLHIHTGGALNRIQNRAELIQPDLGAPFKAIGNQITNKPQMGSTLERVRLLNNIASKNPRN